MRISRKGEVWDERRYVEPTPAEKAADFEERQKRCPYDLRDMDSWPAEYWHDWGLLLAYRGVRMADMSVVEQHAVNRAKNHLQLVERFCKDMADIDVNKFIEPLEKEIENERTRTS